jgi:hypothetical protein
VDIRRYAADVAGRMVRRTRQGTSRVALAVAMGLTFLCAGGVAADDIVHLATERAGTLTVRQCTYSYLSRAKRYYDCAGDYVSDDGQLRVTGVTLANTRWLDPGERTRVTLSGPDDHAAHAIGYVSVVVALMLAAGAGAVLIVLAVRRGRRSGRPPRAPA